MKKTMLLGLFVLGLSSMSFAPAFEEEVGPKPRLITHTCPNGYEFEYYDLDQYTEEDHEDIQSTVCNDPNNQPEFTP